jgi:molecular chaperone DnaK
MSKVIGIDLGTTNSVVAIMEGGKPTVIINAEGARTTPSIVAYGKNGDLLVGQIAKRQALINPENTFYSVKRFIGRQATEISAELRQTPYKVEDVDGKIRLKYPSLNKTFAPEEISTQVLRKLVNDANKYLGEKVKQAFIKVYAYFNDS